MILQKRDRELLLLCYEHRFLVGDVVREFFFAGNYYLARRRLRLLLEHKLLRETNNPGLSKSRILTLTPAGYRIAQSETKHVIRGSTRTGRATFFHDQLVTAVRLRLARFWSATFVPELALKQTEFNGEIPDGIFEFSSGAKIAIEVENSDKGKGRFQRLAARWAKYPDILLVLYVASSRSLYGCLKRYLETLGSEAQPLGLIVWEDLQAGAPKVWTSRGEMDLLARREF